MKRRWRLWTKWWYSAPVWPHPDWEKQEQTWRHKTCHSLTRFWNYRINCALKIWNVLFLFVSQAHSAAKVQLVNIDLIFRLNLLKVIPNTQLREWTLVWVALVQSLQLRLVKHRPDPVTTSLQHQIFPLALISCFYHINSEARCIPGATPSELPFTRQGSCCRAWSPGYRAQGRHSHEARRLLWVFFVVFEKSPSENPLPGALIPGQKIFDGVNAVVF